MALPFEKLHLLPSHHSPATTAGPMGPRNFVVVGSWWLTREVELSTARAAMVTLEAVAGGGPIARWSLPASKNDPTALGTSRAHRCQCAAATGGTASPLCPVHAIWDQLLLLKKHFPSRWHDGKPRDDLPLFPTQLGGVVTKEAAVETLEWAARHLGAPASTPDGSERLSGHSMRATGAQGLAARGWHLWTLQLLGRWGSEAIRTYVREAPLQAMLHSPSPTTSMDIDEVVAALATRLRSAAAPAPLPGSSALVDAPSLAREHLARQEAAPQDFVANDVSGIVHVRATPDMAKCGWRFARRPHSLSANAPQEYCRCANCFA